MPIKAVWQLQPADVPLGRGTPIPTAHGTNLFVVDFIGGGAFGKVYSVSGSAGSTVRIAIVKVFRRALDQDVEDFRIDVSREFNIGKLVRSRSDAEFCGIDGVCPHEMWFHPGDNTLAFIKFPYADAVSLRDYAQRNLWPRLYDTEDETVRTEATVEGLRLIVDVLTALGHMHALSIFHRDLAPRNILVTRRDGVIRASLIDFGVACTDASSFAAGELRSVGVDLQTTFCELVKHYDRAFTDPLLFLREHQLRELHGSLGPNVSQADRLVDYAAYDVYSAGAVANFLFERGFVAAAKRMLPRAPNFIVRRVLPILPDDNFVMPPRLNSAIFDMGAPPPTRKGALEHAYKVGIIYRAMRDGAERVRARIEQRPSPKRKAVERTSESSTESESPNPARGVSP